MAARVLAVPFGAPATRALAGLVAELRGGDPLAPLTVTVPSAAAGTALRRRLAGDAGGLAAVTFQSLPQLAARLAGPSGVPPAQPPAVVRGHIRAALRALDDGPLARAGASAATERAVEATLADLDDLDDAALDVLARRGGTAAAAVQVARAVRRGVGGPTGRGGLLRAAVAAVTGRCADLAAVGPVVVHLPRRLRRGELDLLAALAAAGHATAVVVGRTGDALADEPGEALLAAVADALGTEPEVVGEPAVPAVDLLVRAPDPAEEAAVAARLVLGALADGTASAPERVAVLYRVAEPHAAVLHEQLAAAGIPHHGRSVRTLAQSVAGRVLLGALALAEGGWRRAEVVAWWRSAPVRDLATGRPVPAAWWDRLAREAGVVAGLDQWHQRLDQAAEDRRARLARRPPADDGTPPEDGDARLAAFEDLRAAVTALAERLTPPAGGTWASWARWAAELLDDALATGGADWSAEELDARAAVEAAVADLARLDGVDDPPDLGRFRHALERELERPARAHGRFGHGVAVGPLVDAVGSDLDLVVVVGAAEGTFPPRGSDDTLVPDRDRRASGLVAPRQRSRGEETRDLLAALAGAGRRVLVAPRCDPRAQRERQPAPAFLDAATARASRLVASADLDGLHHADVPWLCDVASFEWWPSSGRADLLPADVDRAALLADHRAGRPVEASAPAVADPDLARGLAAGLARRRGDFDAWSGNVGGRPELLDGLDRPRSPTSLEHYATCPFRYFLAQVLGVRPVDDPTDADEISGRDLGSLVHLALERFVGERGIGRSPTDGWSDDDRARLAAIAEEVADAFEDLGRTGRPLLWEVRRDQLRRLLDGVLDADERLRRERGVTPVAVEHRFGIEEDGAEPVVLELGDGRSVAFRGVVDRIDATADGGLLVLDYKTGTKRGYEDLDEDITARGRRLQLGVYALAARRDHGPAATIDTRYWFLGAGGEADLVGAVFDEAAEERFRSVVGTVLDGVVAGRFPANPGDERWDRRGFVHDHCRYCEFDRVCPSARGRRWQQLRELDELAAYVELAEGPLPEPGGEGEGEG